MDGVSETSLGLCKWVVWIDIEWPGPCLDAKKKTKMGS